MSGILAHSDGGCRGNPGIGAWAFSLHNPTTGTTLECTGGERDTTNNRMELTAAIEALTALQKPVALTLYTDSQYVIKGITEWLPAWKRRGWRTAGNKPVLNADLWRALEAANDRHRVTWSWVRGHSGHSGNERVDQLANEAMDRLQRGEDPAWTQRC